MTLLHVQFALRNQQAFQRLLDVSNERSAGISSSSSGGKSWSKGGAVGMAVAAQVNARDRLGRTVLHLACTSIDTLEYLRLLLRHPAVDVNVQDTENRWTALHRALYHGNIAAAILLLEHADIDMTVKDTEGYTAFELYNSTVEGTKPVSASGAELFTWGANRNAALGLGDGNDRLHPDQVIITQKDADETSSIYARFLPLSVQEIQMAKLHTLIVTSEKRANVRACGFGSGGRLGPGQHTRYSLTQIPQLSQTVVSVALGQDHTLALTESGEILSWGLNRFSQLGYPVETTTSGRVEEPVQVSPKKIVGPLKKEIVQGIAASKTASACWTATEVFTWGTNHGQLGYDKTAQPVQIFPRRVSKITKPVVSMCLTDSAMVCLLNSQDVICIWSDRSFKINFPSHGFPHEIQPYRPPQAVKGAHITKVTSCDETVAFLSSNGEVFVFTVPPPIESDNTTFLTKAFTPSPAWTLKKQLSAAKDIAVGSDGTLIVCTESGHVFVRSRKSGISSKASKYQVVPYIQRVVAVCANSTGAFGALRVDFSPKPVPQHGNTISQDLADIFPPLVTMIPDVDDSKPLDASYKEDDDEDEEDSDIHIREDSRRLSRLVNVIFAKRTKTECWHFDTTKRLPHGADMTAVVSSSKHVFPVHKVLLSARSHHIRSLLRGASPIQDLTSKVSLRTTFSNGTPCLTITHCHPMSVLLLLDYLYSDRVLAIWDRRLSVPRMDSSRIKLELQTLARLLDLYALSKALSAATKTIPEPMMMKDMSALFLCPDEDADVVLQFQDKDVHCHSAILRARTVFFADFFGEEEWTRKRRDAKGKVKVDMKHRKWHVMRYVLRFVCCGEGVEMFHVLEFADSLDVALEFMFDVMGAATELHLDRLVLLVSSVILRFLNIYNAAYILSEATHYSAPDLTRSVQEYIAVNIESLLESRMLDLLHPSAIKQLSQFVSSMQAEKSPTTRNNLLGIMALAKHAEWAELEDFPVPIVHSNKQLTRRQSIKLSSPRPSPSMLRMSMDNSSSKHVRVAAPASPILAPKDGNDDIFTMDEEPDDLPPPVPGRPIPWKASSTPRVDMRSVMAETAAIKGPAPILPSTPPRQSTKGSSLTGSDSPWRYPTSTPPSSRKSEVFPSLSSSPSPMPKASSSRTPMASLPIPPSQGLGPVFVPVKPSVIGKPATPARHVSSSHKAWNALPSQPVIELPLPSGVAMSFAAIQQSQQMKTPEKVKRSLVEIQEEERARLAEEEFLRWWQEEEERVRVEEQVLAQSLIDSHGSGKGRARGGSKGRGGSRGGASGGGRKPKNPKKDRGTCTL